MKMKRDTLETLCAWHAKRQAVALAVVTETWRSAPRPTGSLMAVTAEGVMAGSVSGGCVESAVAGMAQQAIRSGAVQQQRFGVDDEAAWALGLPCGGSIEVAVLPVTDIVPLEKIIGWRADRTACALSVDLASGVLSATEAGGETFYDRESQVFTRAFIPAERVLIIGAVHIAQGLMDLCTTVGLDATLIDPRSGFGAEQRFPGVEINRAWPDEALNALKPDERTAVVCLSHDAKLDDPALITALTQHTTGYVGALGSTRSHARRRERLSEAGVSEADFARISGPVGLDIGAQTPEEIALSIVSEIVATFRGGAILETG